MTNRPDITIPRPHVPYGPQGVPEDTADVDYLRDAARKLEEFYKPFGSNLRATIVKLIRDTADAIETPRNPIAAVLTLHKPFEDQVLTGDCSIESCDHEDECPTVPFMLCTECHRLANEVDAYYGENGVEEITYPCATIRAIEGAAA